MISDEYGTVFSNAEYDKLEKVYSVWICMNPVVSRRNTISKYSIKEENVVGHTYEPENNYDLMSVLMICLNGAHTANYEGILKFLDVLLSPEYEAHTKKTIMEKEFHIPMTKNVESEVENMCNLSQGVIELGRSQGIAEGQLNEKISLIIKKVKKGKPIDVIAEELEEDTDTVTPIYEAVVSQAPDYDMEKIIKNISTK